MSKPYTDEEILIAYNILKDDVEAFDFFRHDFLPAKQISVEHAIIKKQEFERLSEESKELIMIIVNAPSEVIEVLKTPKTKKITQRSIQLSIAKALKSDWIAERIIREIKQWVNQL